MTQLGPTSASHLTEASRTTFRINSNNNDRQLAIPDRSPKPVPLPDKVHSYPNFLSVQ